MRLLFHKRNLAIAILPVSAALIFAGLRGLYTRSSKTAPETQQPVVSTPPQNVSTPEPVCQTEQSRSSPDNSSASRPAPQNISTNEEADLDDALAVTQNMNRLLDDGDDLKALAAARSFLRDPNREVRAAALRAMDWIGLPAVMDMTQLTDDPDEEIRAAARDSFWKMLSRIEDDTLRKNLLSIALQSPDSEMRESALNELIPLPDALAFELIASAMDDPEKSVAALAKENIEFISGQEFESRTAAVIWFEEHKQNLNP